MNYSAAGAAAAGVPSFFFITLITPFAARIFTFSSPFTYLPLVAFTDQRPLRFLTNLKFSFVFAGLFVAMGRTPVHFSFDRVDVFSRVA